MVSILLFFFVVLFSLGVLLPLEIRFTKFLYRSLVLVWWDEVQKALKS